VFLKGPGRLFRIQGSKRAAGGGIQSSRFKEGRRGRHSKFKVQGSKFKGTAGGGIQNSRGPLARELRDVIGDVRAEIA